VKGCKNSLGFEFKAPASCFTASESARTRYRLDIHEIFKPDKGDQITMIPRNNESQGNNGCLSLVIGPGRNCYKATGDLSRGSKLSNAFVDRFR